MQYSRQRRWRLPLVVILSFGAVCCLAAWAVPHLLANLLSHVAHWNEQPAPTQRTVTTGNIVGAWYQDLTEPPGMVMHIEFRADGSFVQTVGRPGATPSFTHAGRWSIDQSAKLLVLDSALLYQQPQVLKPDYTTWSLVDDPSEPNGVSIWGGIWGDPDLERKVNRVRQVPSR